MRLYLAFIILVLTHLKSYCQHDSTYIKTYYDKLIVKPFVGGPQYFLLFQPTKGTDSLASIYMPNMLGIVGASLAYKSFSVNISRRAGLLKNQDVYGKTRYSYFAAKISPKKLTIEFNYQKYKGYADINTRSYDKSRPHHSPYIVRNDLENKYYKLKGIYQLNRTKYSYPAAFTFTQRQLKSATALFVMGSINHIRMDADSSFFPTQTRTLYGDLQSMTNLRSYGFAGAIGGGFNVVHKKFFLSGILFLGLELQHQKYFLQEFNRWKTDIRPAGAADARLSLGMSGDRAFVALTAKGDFNNLEFKTFKGNAIFALVTIDFGYRFNAPKAVEKVYSTGRNIIRKILFME